MKTILKIFLILFIVFYSCDKIDNKYHYLDHSEWFRYKLFDTLIYKSADNTDIYLINNMYTTYEVFDKKYYNEYFCTQYKCLTDSINYTLTGFCRFLDAINVNTQYHTDGVGFVNYNTIKLQIGDSLINNVYKINCSRIDSVNYRTKTFYYSHIYGVIRYDMYNDEVFELQLK